MTSRSNKELRSEAEPGADHHLSQLQSDVHAPLGAFSRRLAAASLLKTGVEGENTRFSIVFPLAVAGFHWVSMDSPLKTVAVHRFSIVSPFKRGRFMMISLP